jgi:hypothetical protein
LAADGARAAADEDTESRHCRRHPEIITAVAPITGFMRTAINRVRSRGAGHGRCLRRRVLVRFDDVFRFVDCGRSPDTYSARKGCGGMTGDEFRAVCFKLGLSALQWGQALGYAGTTHNIRNQIRRYEHEVRPIPPWKSGSPGCTENTASRRSTPL